MPGDRVIVRWTKAAILGRASHRLVHVTDQAAVKGEPGEDRQVALGDAEGQIAAGCIAPLGNDPAAAQNEAVRAAARPYRAERLVPRRLFAEIGRDRVGQIAAPWRLVLGGVLRGGGKRTGVETGGLRRGVLPLDWIGRRNIGHEVVS